MGIWELINGFYRINGGYVSLQWIPSQRAVTSALRPQQSETKCLNKVNGLANIRNFMFPFCCCCCCIKPPKNCHSTNDVLVHDSYYYMRACSNIFVISLHFRWATCVWLSFLIENKFLVCSRPLNVGWSVVDCTYFPSYEDVHLYYKVHLLRSAE